MRAGHDVLAPSRAELDLLREDPLPAMARLKPDALLHLAWCAEPGSFWTAPANVDWLMASLNLLRAFAATGGRRVVMAGTCAEYDWRTTARRIREDAPLVQATLYGATKDALRRVAEPWCAQHDLSLAWGRIFFVYGPGEPAARFVSSIAHALLAHGSAPMTHGRQVRDFLFVQDAGEAFAALLQSDVQGTVNIASGRAVTLAEIARAVVDEVGHGEGLRLGALPEREGEPARLVASVDRLNGLVGWRPGVELVDGVAQTVASVRA